MRKVHLVKGLVVYVYWIDTVYVQNTLPTELRKKDNFHNLKKNMLKMLLGGGGNDVLNIFFYFLYV